MAHLTDESTGHQHQPKMDSKCMECVKLAKSYVQAGKPSLGKGQSTIRSDEEPLSK